MEGLRLKMEVAALKRPIQIGWEDGFCGDATLVVDGPSSIFLALFDAAGHGYAASKTADIAMRFLKLAVDVDLVELLISLHQVLLLTDGGCAAVCRIEKKTARLTCAGIGDVAIRLFTPESKHFVTRAGVLGHEIAKPKLYEKQLNPGDMLMLYSDGVKDHFRADDFLDFFSMSAANVARMLIDYSSKALDDAAIIVLKVKDD